MTNFAIIIYTGPKNKRLDLNLKKEIYYSIVNNNGSDVSIVEFDNSELENVKDMFFKEDAIEVDITQDDNNIRKLVEIISPLNGVLPSSTLFRGEVAKAFYDKNRRNALIDVLKTFEHSDETICKSKLAKQIGLSKQILSLIKEARQFYILD